MESRKEKSTRTKPLVDRESGKDADAPGDLMHPDKPDSSLAVQKDGDVEPKTGHSLSDEERERKVREIWTSDERLGGGIWTNDGDFLVGLLFDIMQATVWDDGKLSKRKRDFALSVVKGIKPRDQTEAMLGAQMAVTHMATMRLAWTLVCAKSIPQQDSASNAMNKLARTYVTQMEALKKYRTGGQQKVTVEHVTVNEGGQAIVGNVSHGEEGRKKNDR
jgi:hypothetical protein